MEFKKLYIELGKLLYAVAKSDGTIQKQEKEAIQKFVKSQLTPLESSIDKYGSDQAFYTEFEFDTLQAFDASSEQALGSFIQFVHTHPQIFTSDVIKLVFDAVKQVADAYKGITKSEEKIIEVLNEEFKKIKKQNASN